MQEGMAPESSMWFCFPCRSPGQGGPLWNLHKMKKDKCGQTRTSLELGQGSSQWLKCGLEDAATLSTGTLAFHQHSQGILSPHWRSAHPHPQLGHCQHVCFSPVTFTS